MGGVKQGVELYKELGPNEAALFVVLALLVFLIGFYFLRVWPDQRQREIKVWESLSAGQLRQEQLMKENNALQLQNQETAKTSQVLLQGFVDVITSQAKMMAAHDERSVNIGRDVDHINETIKMLAAAEHIERLGEQIEKLGEKITLLQLSCNKKEG